MKSGFFAKKKQAAPEQPTLPRAALTEADAIITPNEANERHGIGIIVERFFSSFPNTLSIRSQNNFGGVQQFGAQKLQISHLGLARWESYQRVIQLLNGTTVRRIVCIPFLPDDLITAICLHELFQAPLCIYVMDDNNIGAHGIPDYLFREALQKCSLALGISAEIRDAYAEKYQHPFHVLPPLLDARLLQTAPLRADAQLLQNRTAALIGNVWSQKWLDRLRATIRESGLRVHWFGNTTASWLKYSQDELAADGITTFGFLPEGELLSKLRTYPFALIPSGSLDAHDDRPELARLSLPSRIPYLAGSANLPLIVLGNPETAAGHFVQNFGLGVVCSYNGEALTKSALELCDPNSQSTIRKKAAHLGDLFTLSNPGQWVWESLKQGRPLDDKFDRLLPRRG